MIELITKLNDCEDKIKELCKIDGVGKEYFIVNKQKHYFIDGELVKFEPLIV